MSSDISNIMGNIWGPAIRAQLNETPRLLLPKSDKPPLHGPPTPPLLVRDLIKRLQTCNPNAFVYYEDYEQGPCQVMRVIVAGHSEVVIR